MKVARQVVVHAQAGCKILVNDEPELELKKYRVKVSMAKPFEFLDYWAKQPNGNMAIETLINELLLRPDAGKYFNVEVTEVKDFSR